MANSSTRFIIFVAGAAALIGIACAVYSFYAVDKSPAPTFDFGAVPNEDALQQYIEKDVIVCGEWHNSGVEGPYITNQSGNAPIYILAMKDTDLERVNSLHVVHFDGQQVTVSGVLHKREPSNQVAPPEVAPTVKKPQQLYYFDVSTLKDSPHSIVNFDWIQARASSILQMFSQHRSR